MPLLALDTFLMLSVLVGLGQVIAAVDVIRHGGRVRGAMAPLALAELVWAFICWQMAWGDTPAGLPLWLPGAFVVYSMASAWAGVRHAAQQPEAAETMRLKPVHALASLLFGATFAGVSGLLWWLGPV